MQRYRLKVVVVHTQVLEVEAKYIIEVLFVWHLLTTSLVPCQRRVLASTTTTTTITITIIIITTLNSPFSVL